MAKKVITTNMSALSKRHRRIAQQLPQALERGYEQIGVEAIGMYGKTVRTWKHQPRFYTRRTARGITINTDSAIYGYVDYGTRPHIIEARRAPMLVFRWPYKAATKPRIIASYNAVRGPNWASKRRVKHPGTKARNFTDEITRRMIKRSNTIMRAEINKAANVEAVGI